jgi:hypothetical protein
MATSENDPLAIPAGTPPEQARAIRAARRAEKEALMTKAFEMRKGGATTRQIGRALNRTHGTVSKWLQTVSKQLAAERIEDGRAILEVELARLDAATMAVMPLVNHQNQELALKAVDRLVRIGERRSKLLGLDAPTKVAPTNPGGDEPWNPMDAMTSEQLAERAATLLAYIKTHGDS